MPHDAVSDHLQVINLIYKDKTNTTKIFLKPIRKIPHKSPMYLCIGKPLAIKVHIQKERSQKAWKDKANKEHTQ